MTAAVVDVTPLADDRVRVTVVDDEVASAYLFVRHSGGHLTLDLEKRFHRDFGHREGARTALLDTAWRALRGEPLDVPFRLPDDPPGSRPAVPTPVRQIGATGPDTYEVVFDDGERVRFTATVGDGLLLWSTRPESFQVGPRGVAPDTRAVYRAVQELHTARSGMSARTTHPLVERAIECARDDPAGLRSLIDWPVSGLRRVVGGLTEVPERDRAMVVSSGLDELDAAADSPDLVADVLRPLAARFAAAREVRVASPGQRQLALAGWRVPTVPAGLTDAQGRRLSTVRDRTATLDEVLVLVDERDQLPVAPVPGTGLLAVRLPD
ncbi:MAG: hypothetical protein WCA46_19375 [Actinocatenispora sp.]